MGYSMPSETELAARGGGDKVLLPEDEYKVEVVSIEIKKDQRNPYNGEVRDTLTVRLKPIAFADGSVLVDKDGGDVEDDRLLFDFIDPTKVGMKPQPSKARKFFTSALGLPLGSGITIEDYDDLKGKRMLATVVVRPARAEKPEQNSVTAYRGIPARPTRAARPVAAETTDAAAAAEAAISVSTARAIFDEDEDF